MRRSVPLCLLCAVCFGQAVPLDSVRVVPRSGEAYEAILTGAEAGALRVVVGDTALTVLTARLARLELLGQGRRRATEEERDVASLAAMRRAWALQEASEVQFRSIRSGQCLVEVPGGRVEAVRQEFLERSEGSAPREAFVLEVARLDAQCVVAFEAEEGVTVYWLTGHVPSAPPRRVFRGTVARLELGPSLEKLWEDPQARVGELLALAGCGTDPGAEALRLGVTLGIDPAGGLLVQLSVLEEDDAVGLTSGVGLSGFTELEEKHRRGRAEEIFLRAAHDLAARLASDGE